MFSRYPFDRLISAQVLGLGIFLLALTLRLTFAFQWSDLPYGNVPLWDAKGHDEWALKILQGHFLQDTAFYSSPLYPYFLALLYKLFGHSFLVVSVVNALFDSLTCMLLSLIALEQFGKVEALLTGLLGALCRSMIFYTAPIMKESLGLFLLAAFTYLILRALRSGQARTLAASGFCLGLCALIRGNVLLLVPAVIILMFLQRQSIGSPSRKSGVFVLAVLLAILPATLHNAVASRDFVLINYDDGFNLYLGNSPWATGISYSFPPFISADTRPEEITVTLVARQASGGNELSPSAVSAYWRNQALTYIFENPVHIVKMWRTKFLAFWNVEQQFDNYDIPFIQQNFPTVLSLPLVTLRLISPLAFLAAVGLWRTRHEKIVPFVLLGTIYMGSVLLFYVTDRYRLPMLIFLLPLAGAVVPTIVTLAQSKRWRSLGAALVAAIVMTILSLWPQATPNFTAYDWGTLSSLESDSGHYEESISMIDKGLAVSPSEVGAEGMIKAAYAYEKLGLADQAEALLQQARILYPGDGSVLYNIGRLQALAGHLSDALESFQKAMSLSPNFILSYLGVASIEQHLGHADKAREALARGLVIDPQNIQLRALEQQL